jgi:hypothetical protein
MNHLNCSYNYIKELCHLPPTLHTLKCSYNEITFITPYIANTLIELKCEGNNLPYYDLNTFKEWAARYILNVAIRGPRLKRTLFGNYKKQKLHPELLQEVLHPERELYKNLISDVSKKIFIF